MTGVERSHILKAPSTTWRGQNPSVLLAWYGKSLLLSYERSYPAQKHDPLPDMMITFTLESLSKASKQLKSSFLNGLQRAFLLLGLFKKIRLIEGSISIQSINS